MAAACSTSTEFGLPGLPGFGTGADANPASDATDLISALSTEAFSDDDLVAARTAAAKLLAHDKGGRWENPLTGARGTVTPIATAYRDNGIACRDFLVSYVREKTEAWMQGEACRGAGNRWNVRSLKPWRR
ncbi:MAG: hypothetical protein J2P53_09870 [Bradyrhizobiaceae bacterium]|nr:hypothetical protein [Bradyrhizobiaceae bacterium]